MYLHIIKYIFSISVVNALSRASKGLGVRYKKNTGMPQEVEMPAPATTAMDCASLRSCLTEANSEQFGVVKTLVDFVIFLTLSCALRKSTNAMILKISFPTSMIICGIAFRRFKILVAALALLSLGSLLLINPNTSPKHYWLKFTYLTRPLWDKPSKDFIILNHFYTPNLSLDQACHLHGWNASKSPPKKVFDAVLFSIEIELLLV